tara:strand:+ start:360 stop:569 length:210 start_codon:yes stop_codon:yes gene_type:complete
MRHKDIIELANGQPIYEHKTGETECKKELSYTLTLIEEHPPIEECPRPKELYQFDFFSIGEMHTHFKTI